MCREAGLDDLPGCQWWILANLLSHIELHDFELLKERLSIKPGQCDDSSEQRRLRFDSDNLLRWPGARFASASRRGEGGSLVMRAGGRYDGVEEPG